MKAHAAYSILPLGDTALLVHFGDAIEEKLNRKVLSLFHHLKARNLPGVLDIIPAYSSLTVCYDVVAVRQKGGGHKTAFEHIAGEVRKTMERVNDQSLLKSLQVKVPVCYAGGHAPDLYEVARQKGITAEDVVRLHTARAYRVYMIGFLPGFAYMGEVDERIAVPRKAQPRVRLEAGSVGIAGNQTGIYPVASPGGWQIIGKTPVKIFDPESENPVLFQPGDVVEFYSITEDEFEDYQSRNS